MLSIGGASGCPLGGIFGDLNAALHYMPRTRCWLSSFLPEQGSRSDGCCGM